MLCLDEMTTASMPASSRSASSRALSNGGDAASAFANDNAVGLSVTVSSFADLARGDGAACILAQASDPVAIRPCLPRALPVPHHRVGHFERAFTPVSG